MAASSDWRALTLLERRPTTRDEKIGGIAFALGATILVPALIALVTAVIGAINFESGQKELPPLPVIETRFVKLGKRDLPPDLPAVDTAPATEPEAAPESEPAPESAPAPASEPASESEPEPATDDLLAELQDKAQKIADSQKPVERHGDEEGIAEGTETRENADIYLGKLYTYFKRGWQVPTHIGDDELKLLACTVDVSITTEGAVEGFKVTRSSGNDAFDESVLRRMNDARGATLPDPPEGTESKFFGQTISLRFFGKHAR